MNKILEESSMVIYPSEGRKRKCVKVECPTCKTHFWRDKRGYNKAKGLIYCSTDCKHENDRTIVECAYCKQPVTKTNSALEGSRSGLYFCCREHKDLAQRIENNNQELWLPHYGSSKEYRAKALREYGRSCSHCGYDELDINVVHHIDRNRDNNELDNLLVVCPNCHEAIHKGFYIVENRTLKKI